MKSDELENILWSIALPGFAQLRRGKLVKGILFVGLELIINENANFNLAIMFSFQGHIQRAIEVTDFQWLMFYPCLYFFAMWDAIKDTVNDKSPLAFLPFVFSAFFVTVGVIYSPTFTILNVLPGPIWLPILCLPFGILAGLLLQKLLPRLLRGLVS